MEKFQLNNGMSVVFAGHSKDYSVCLSVNIGHVNEPSKGIAALFEKTPNNAEYWTAVENFLASLK